MVLRSLHDGGWWLVARGDNGDAMRFHLLQEMVAFSHTLDVNSAGRLIQNEQFGDSMIA